MVSGRKRTFINSGTEVLLLVYAFLFQSTLPTGWVIELFGMPGMPGFVFTYNRRTRVSESVKNARTAGVRNGALGSVVFDRTCVGIASCTSIHAIYFDSEVAANDVLERSGPME